MQYQALHPAFWNTGAFWVTVAVILFLVVFGRKMVGGIIAGVDARSDAIQRELDEAKHLRLEAEAMLRDAEQRQREAIETARDIAANAKQRADRLAADLAREAADTQARRETMVTERIHAAQAAAIKEVRAAAASLAVEAAARVLAEQFDAERDAASIDAAIADLPARLNARRAA